ncbi:MAG: hypothetical protein HZLCBSQH_000618 [Candidatus Fervidibacterota bacterium]
MIFIISTLVTLFSIFLYFILFYNLTLVNKIYTYVTLQVYVISSMYFIFILTYSLQIKNNFTIYRENVFKLYTNFLRILFNSLLLQYIIIVLFFVLFLLESDLIMFLKLFVFLCIVVLIESMLFFLIWTFYRHRWLITVVYGGTVLLAPLITEAMNFLREPWMRSVLMFWNWIVPYQVLSGAQNTLFAEGWQQMDLLVINAIYALVYCFIVASICLYIRQLQTSWVFPSPLKGGE